MQSQDRGLRCATVHRAVMTHSVPLSHSVRRQQIDLTRLNKRAAASGLWFLALPLPTAVTAVRLRGHHPASWPRKFYLLIVSLMKTKT